MKRLLALGVFVLFSLGLVMAMSVPEFKEAVVTKSHNGVVFTIPEHATEVSPGVFFIGTSLDSDGSVLEGYAILDYKKKKENAKPPWAGGGGNTKADSCYAFLANGAKWKVQEDYLVDPSNSAGLNEQFVRDNLAQVIGEWESAAGSDIFGNEAVGNVDSESIGNTANNQNEVVFGSINQQGVIAVTYVWGIFSGPPSNRRLAEWDQVYNQNDFTWNNNGNVNDMDFENIAQHEVGHAFGLGHPSDGCTEETMLRYASLGETKKRDLNSGDISGIQGLYA